MQIAISADRRYGPLFNQGVAEVIVNGLMRHGYTLESTAPVFLIGYSGAGQIAVGASGHLKRWLKSPVYVISLGGVFVSGPALLEIDHLFHLVGTRDAVEPWWIMAPGRWSVFYTSEWNRARRQGRTTTVNMGPMRHTGGGGYMDAKKHLPDGREYIDVTVRIVTEIVRTLNIRLDVRGRALALTSTDKIGDPWLEPAAGDAAKFRSRRIERQRQPGLAVTGARPPTGSPDLCALDHLTIRLGGGTVYLQLNTSFGAG